MKGFFRKNAVLGFAEIFGRLPLVFAAGYVAKTLGPEVYGNWALVLAFTGVLVMFASLGLSSSLSRLASVATPEQARGYLGMALGMSVLTTLACGAPVAGLHNPLAHVFGLDDDVAWLLIPGAALALVGVTESLLDGYFKSRILVARGSLFILIRSLIECFAIISVFGGYISVPGIDGVELLALYVVINMTLKFIAYPFLVRFRAPPAERAPAEQRRTFLQYGLPMIPASIVVFLTAQGDRLVLGHLLSKEALGVYAFGASLAAYMMYIGYATNPLLLPRASVM